MRVLIGLLACSLLAEEGKWTPPQMLEFDAKHLASLGLRIAPRDLWDPAKGSGLLSAAISTSGCSAGFVSATGLLATNHHCIFGILQEHSTPQNDLATNGFLARTREAELPGKTMRITVPKAFRDVTAEIEAAAAKAPNDLVRYEIIERKRKEITAACESKPARRCLVATYDGGVQYLLQEMIEIRDVRLAYAPARSIGEYGGEVDNWMWPRHTGDFGIARAYVSPNGEPAFHSKDNVPYRPEKFFPISQRPLKEGDFVMVLGYPGVTYRSLLAEEMRERRDRYYTRRVDLFGEWIQIFEDVSRRSAEGRIAVAADLKSMLNRFKNAQGQIEGFRRGNLLERQQEAEEAVATWAAARPEWRDAAGARKELLRHFEERLTTWERDFLLDNIQYGSKALYFAVTLARLSRERQKPDLERDEDYMDRNLSRLRANLERAQKSYFPEADQRMLEAFLSRVHKLPSSQRITALDGIANSDLPRLYASSKVLNVADRLAMFHETEAQLKSHKDPLLDIGFALDDQMARVRETDNRWQGTVSRLRPKWRRAVAAHAGKPVAPDANRTLRVSFAHVKGYTPRDGMRFVPFTTLSGILQKNTGQDPFDAPKPVLEAASAKRYGKYRDAVLHDVPVNFLATGDTTGGNSGSPVINGFGELAGLNFDRVWENVANDFGYNPALARNVSADVRYLLWTLSEIEKADELLRELGIR
ncbi:MAG: S46 family peptidase [Bryobacterales bacterium]|nr:S46 family peptidase [Bryobacterales bacterium]